MRQTTLATPQTSGSRERFVKRFALTASLSALALTATASPAGAVQIGQLGAVPGADCAISADRVQPTVTSGNSYVVPSTGGVNEWTVRSWSTTPTEGSVKMKMYRPVGPGVFTAVAQDVTRTLTSTATNTFQVDLPVRSGDVLGLDTITTYPCSFVAAGDSYLRTATGATSDLANGDTGIFPETVADRRLQITAQVNPTNTIELGKVRKNKRKGIATITVAVPNPGALEVSGTRVRGSANVPKAGDVKLKIRAAGKKKRKLNKTGKVKVKPLVSFTPTGGTEGTPESRKIKLKKR